MNNKALETYVELFKEKMMSLTNERFKKPWLSPKLGIPQNINGRSYNNSNKFFLFILMEKNNWKYPVFMTFKQAQTEGCFPLKGSKGFPVIHFDIGAYNINTKEKITLDEYNKLSNTEKADYRIYKNTNYFTVFNIDQTNLSEKNPEKYNKIKEQFTIKLEESKGIANEKLDNIIDNQKWLCPINLKMQDKAFYSPTNDEIVLPLQNQFVEKEKYYGTCLHEMAHSTGHEKRLNRNIKNMFGSIGYSREELVAELTSSVVASQMGIIKMPSAESADYVRDWLNNITSDPNYLNTIIKDVGKATGMIENVIDQEKITNKSQDIESASEIIKDEQLHFKGGRKEIFINSPESGTIICNNKEYSANALLKDFKDNNIDYKKITSEQWENILKATGIQLSTENPDIRFSIQMKDKNYRLTQFSTDKSSSFKIDKGMEL